MKNTETSSARTRADLWIAWRKVGAVMEKKKLIDAGDLTMCLNDWAVSVKVEKFDDTEWKYTERDLMQMKYRTIVDCMGMVDGQQEVEAVPADAVGDLLDSIGDALAFVGDRLEDTGKRLEKALEKR